MRDLDVLTDVRHSLRAFRRTPLSAAVITTSLALGIAATTTVFSFVNAIQFKPLPVEDEDTLVDVSETSATRLCSGCAVGTSYPGFVEWRDRARSFQAMGAYREERFVVSGAGGPERVGGAIVSAALFDIIGVGPALGRGFTAADDLADASPAVLISDLVWQRQFAGDAAVVGRQLRVNGVDRTVIGVMPAGFRFPEFAQLWIPVAPAALRDRTDRSLAVVARLARESTIESAGAEMRAIAAAQALEHPATNDGWSAAVASLREDLTSETAMASIALLGAVTFVLLIACANVANLLVARGADRTREIAIRMALGARRQRIAWLMIAESLALAVPGGAIGMLATLWASRLLVAKFGIAAPYWIQFGLDWRVFGFCAAITGAVAILCGLAPAWHATRNDVQDALKEGGAVTDRPSGRGFRNVLAAGQLALALVLLAGAGLLIKTVVRTFAGPPRYDASRVLVGDLHLQDVRYERPAAAVAFASRLLEGLQRLPGTDAAVSRSVFFAGFGESPRRISVDGMSETPAGASPNFYNAVSPGYLAIHGIVLVEGRLFTAREADVAIVNREMARRIWPGRSPLGQRIRFGDASSRAPWLTVIGVADDEGGHAYGNTVRPAAYVPFDAHPGREFAVHLRTPGDAAPFAREIRREVAAIDPDQPIEDLMTMEQALAAWAAPARFVALLMSSLSAIALMLACLGTYGVIAYGVSRRAREIGIRLALGASPRQVEWLMARSGARLIVWGALAGLGAAWLCTRVLQGILAGTSPTDPAVFAAGTACLAIAGFLATWLPARRAGRVDPVVVLRSA